MIDIVHRVGIKAAPSKVYAALSTIAGLSGWWTTKTSGEPSVGGSIDFVFTTPAGEQVGAMRMQVVAMEPDRVVHWRCAAGPEEWLGTDIVFKLDSQDGYTIVNFGHRNWREEVEFTGHCSMKWAVFMLSLKELVETGTGRPSPNDLKIDNWN